MKGDERKQQPYWNINQSNGFLHLPPYWKRIWPIRWWLLSEFRCVCACPSPPSYPPPRRRMLIFTLLMKSTCQYGLSNEHRLGSRMPGISTLQHGDREQLMFKNFFFRTYETNFLIILEGKLRAYTYKWEVHCNVKKPLLKYMWF